MENEFLRQLNAHIEDHLTDEQFGVSELAAVAGMSRSNLLRRVKKDTGLSVSQFIRQLRLRKAREMLQDPSLTVSEIAYKVGFSSPSYFIKCFGDHYGYPPGEAGKMKAEENEGVTPALSHQLAAIMFTDIEGYTALMQQDEVMAVAFRARHREVFNALTRKFRGRILQYYGDGTLSTFASAIDAVRCGIELQLAFRQDPVIPVRIGIHSGDIIFTDDDIIGDGVNVASRIESLGVAGSVFISEKVYDEVKNQAGIHTVSMGLFELKNVGRPLEVFAIGNDGLAVPQRDEVRARHPLELPDGPRQTPRREKKTALQWVIIPFMIMLAGYLFYVTGVFDSGSEPTAAETAQAKKSIAVLPFINDSNDSTNVYIINGLMESLLNDLQNINDLRVISRTSVEKYRDARRLVSEIARELNVKYVVEGSGQKIGDRIMLHIQLIDAVTDQHLWSRQYEREAKEIFALQMEVAKNIAGAIEAIITPEEEARIEKVPTEDLVAYDYFLKGLDLFYQANPESLKASIGWFRKAVGRDPAFARAIADIGIAYFFLDALMPEKVYSDSIRRYADEALLVDPTLAQGLIAKALFFMNGGENEKAVPYLEKALEYNPNSALVINILSDFYANHVPNTAKYLEYALLGVRLDIAAHDSATASFIYLHLANALVQSGFADEAASYIEKSLDYNPQNLYSVYVKAYIRYARDRDLQALKSGVLKALAGDSTRLDILQEAGKVCYYQRDFPSSYAYYQQFMAIKEAYNLQAYPGENAKIGLVYEEMGEAEKGEKLFRAFKAYADSDRSIYKQLSLAVYYAHAGDAQRALEAMRLFARQDNFHYWTLIFLEIDPLVDPIKDLPEFKALMETIEARFNESHDQLKAMLEAKELL